MKKQALPVPEELLKLMRLARDTLSAPRDEDAFDDDDEVETDEGYGSRLEPGSEIFTFTFWPKTGGERWEILLTQKDIVALANGKKDSLPRLADNPVLNPGGPTGIFIEGLGRKAVAPLDDVAPALREARKMLGFLLEKEAIELVEDADPSDLEERVAALLEEGRVPKQLGPALSNLLLSHDALEEVFISEHDLTRFLDRW